MRGGGLEIEKTFAWIRQPNGNYTIFAVPIFSTFKDAERGEVTKNDLAAIVNNFLKLKRKNYYSRAHIGHHENAENRPGIGYIDNLSIAGDYLLADIVEIPEKYFIELKNLKYPYVSAEYNPIKKHVSTVAVCESQPSYFKFPILVLSPSPEKKCKRFEDACEKRSSKLQKFQLNCERKKKMDELLETEEEPKKNTEQKFEEDAMPTIKDVHDLLVSVSEKLDELLVLEKKEKEETEESEETEEPEEAMMNNPSSVAYQEKRFLSAQQRAIKELQKEVSVLRAGQKQNEAEQALQKFCAESGQSFAEHKAIMNKFSTVYDKMTYVNALKIAGMPQTKHPASGLAQKFLGHNDNDMKKFQEKMPGVPISAIEAAVRCYQDTVADNPTSIKTKQFKAMWTLDRFVEYYATRPRELESIIVK